MAQGNRSKGVLVLVIVFIVIISVVGYTWLFFSGKGNVGIITIRGYILSDLDRDLVVRMIDHAAENDTIKAVVVEIDSGGGWVAPIEEIYYRLLELGSKKPVVASITGMAASGGYYIAVSAKEIFALPSSEVGNVGVVGFIPSKEQADRYLHDETVMETGPYKLRGTSEKTFPLLMQSIFSGFLDVVATGRGERLKVSVKELGMGRIYTGREALELGLVDEFGSVMEAAESAALMAGLREFGVVDLVGLVPSQGGSLGSLASSSTILSLQDLRKLNQSPCLYYVYVGWQTQALLSEEFESYGGITSYSAWTSSEDGRYVLFDASHGNAYSQEELTPLLAEIISLGHKVSFLDGSEKLEDELERAEAFVVISPRRTFDEDEISSVKSYLKENGKLLLVMDPTRTYPRYMNPLSTELGILFANGYLFNVEENYGNYRYIFARPKDENNITQGIHRLAFFTAAHVYPSSFGIVLGMNNTFWSEAEEAGEYAVMALLPEEGILAIGDQTFFTQPYVTAEDNALLVSNIAQFLTSGSTP